MGAEDGVPESLGDALPDVHDGDVLRDDVLNLEEQLALDTLLEGSLELEAGIEMVLY